MSPPASSDPKASESTSPTTRNAKVNFIDCAENPLREPTMAAVELDSKPPAGFPFFALPRELRDQIYDYALRGFRYYSKLGRLDLCVFYKDDSRLENGPWRFPLWLRSNKQMFEEAMEQFHCFSWCRPEGVSVARNHKPCLPWPAQRLEIRHFGCWGRVRTGDSDVFVPYFDGAEERFLHWTSKYLREASLAPMELRLMGICVPAPAFLRPSFGKYISVDVSKLEELVREFERVLFEVVYHEYGPRGASGDSLGPVENLPKHSKMEEMVAASLKVELVHVGKKLVGMKRKCREGDVCKVRTWEEGDRWYCEASRTA